MSTYLIKSIGGTEYIYPRNAFPLLRSGEAVLHDIRTEYEQSYKRFDVKQTIFMPYNLFDVNLLIPFKGELIIIADSFGLESKKLYSRLKESNFNVICLACGMHDWERDGMPVLTNVDLQASGVCRCQLKPKRLIQKGE